MDKLIKAWIGLMILSGIMIFIHSQELKNELPEDFFIQNQMEEIRDNEKFNSFIKNENGKLFTPCNIFHQRVKKCNHYYCTTVRKIQLDRKLNMRP